MLPPVTSFPNRPSMVYRYLSEDSKINFEMGFVLRGTLNVYRSPEIDVSFKGANGSWTEPSVCIVDTGAFYTFLSPQLVDFLGLPFIEGSVEIEQIVSKLSNTP